MTPSFFNIDPNTFLVLTEPNYPHVLFPVSTTYGLWIPSVVRYLTVTPWQHAAVVAHWKLLWCGESLTNGQVWQRDSWTMMSGSFANLWTNKISSEGENHFASCQALICTNLKDKSSRIKTFASHWHQGFHWITGMVVWWVSGICDISWNYKCIRTFKEAKCTSVFHRCDITHYQISFLGSIYEFIIQTQGWS